METQLQIRPASPMAMASEFLKNDSNVDIEKLSKLLDIQERWEANEAKKAFVEAMTAFKADPPTIVKDKHVKFGTSKGVTEYSHASLSNVTATINEALSSHGLSASWTTDQGENTVSVTCKITHIFGHSEQTTLKAGLDMSGSKNAIQALGSTVSYLQRYTLLSLAGLATEGQDDDGAGAKKEDDKTPAAWTPKQLEFASKLKVVLEESPEGKGVNLDKLKKYLVWHYNQINQTVPEDDKAVSQLAAFLIKKPESLALIKDSDAKPDAPIAGSDGLTDAQLETVKLVKIILEENSDGRIVNLLTLKSIVASGYKKANKKVPVNCKPSEIEKIAAGVLKTNGNSIFMENSNESE